MPSPRTDLRDEIADVLLSHMFDSEDEYGLHCSCGHATRGQHIATHVAEEVLNRLDQLAELSNPGLMQLALGAA